MSTKVHDLALELILHIISYNGNMFHDSKAFHELRMASQVCHSWRAISLSSTALWGHVVDLDRINVKCEDWLAEVLRRTGNAPLWVKFENLNRKLSDEVPDTIVQLLKNDWDRVEILALQYLGPNNQQVLYRPTLCLRTFIYNGPFDHDYDDEYWDGEFEGDGEDESGLNPVPFLAGTAPALRHLKITCSPMHPKRHIYLFSNLRSLSTGVEVNLYALCAILCYTQRLEELYIDCIVPCDFEPHDLSPLPGPAIIKLPHLRHIHLFSNKGFTCDVILGHLEMSDGVSLDLELDIDDVDDIDDYYPDCPDLPKKVGQLAERYFEIHRPATLNIVGDVYRGLKFESSAPVTYQINPFRIHVETDHSRLLFDFVQALSFSGLSCVSNLKTKYFFDDIHEIPCEDENMRIIKNFHACLSGAEGLESRLQRQKEEAMALEEWDENFVESQCYFMADISG